MQARYKVLGIDPDTTECECCGKTNLKLTVVLGHLDADGNPMQIVKFGRNCAAKATRLRRTGAAMESLAQEAQRAADRERANRVVIMDGTTCDAEWIVESIGQNGGSITRLCIAKGLRSEVVAWAEKEFPNLIVQVRLPIRYHG